MESGTTPALPQQSKKHTPWGLLIGLFLILAVLVGGAYYAVTERISPQMSTQSS